MNLLHAVICKHRAQVLQHCSQGLFTWNLVVNGRLHSLRALKWDFLALRWPETEPMWGSWPPYLRDLLCDVLRAVLHLGGAEQLHPGSGRRAAFGAPAGWSHTPYKVRVRHGALLAVRWSEKHICIYIYIKEILRNLCFYSFFSSIFPHLLNFLLTLQLWYSITLLVPILYSWCSFLGLRMLIPSILFILNLYQFLFFQNCLGKSKHEYQKRNFSVTFDILPPHPGLSFPRMQILQCPSQKYSALKCWMVSILDSQSLAALGSK